MTISFVTGKISGNYIRREHSMNRNRAYDFVHRLQLNSILVPIALTSKVVYYDDDLQEAVIDHDITNS